MDVWHWGLNHLPDGKTFDDIRFRDLITVSENDVFNFVTANGFNERVVAERDAARWADDQLCIVPEADGRWSVCYSERGKKYDEVVLPSLADARREVVHRMMTSARISLNHAFRLAHPEMDLPLPSEMD